MSCNRWTALFQNAANVSHRLFEFKFALTYLPDLRQHCHHNVAGQLEMTSSREYGVPHDEQIGQ